MSDRQHYLDLVETLNKHSYQYYVLDDPLISDPQYDVMYQELLTLEAEHPDWVVKESPSQRVVISRSPNSKPSATRWPCIPWTMPLTTRTWLRF